MKSLEALPSKNPEKSFEVREKEHMDKFRERLVKLTPDFLEARKRMGLEDNIGFGLLPRVHSNVGSESLGSLPIIQGKRPERLKYSVPGFLVGTDYINLPKQERENIVVMPNLEAQNKQIVSVFDYYSPFPEDINLLEALDDTFKGIIVHELAHEFDGNNRKKLPKKTREILGEQKQDIKNKKTKLKNRNEYFAQDETEVDIIAASFGYTKQIVAKIDFMIGRFKTLAPKWTIERSISDPSPQDRIEELEFRKQQVLEYCP